MLDDDEDGNADERNGHRNSTEDSGSYDEHIPGTHRINSPRMEPLPSNLRDSYGDEEAVRVAVSDVGRDQAQKGPREVLDGGNGFETRIREQSRVGACDDHRDKSARASTSTSSTESRLGACSKAAPSPAQAERPAESWKASRKDTGEDNDEGEVGEQSIGEREYASVRPDTETRLGTEYSVQNPSRIYYQGLTV